MSAADPDTIDVKPPSKADVAAAEGARAAAHLARIRREIRERCEEPFEVEDETLTAGDDTTDVIVRRMRAEARAKERMLALSDEFRGIVTTPEAAGAAADTIIAVEDECEREERVLQALLARVKRRAEWTREMLWGALEHYARTNPRSKDGKGRESKSWKLPWTTARLTERTSEARVEVRDRTACLRWIKDVIGGDRAIDLDIVKIEETIRVGPLRDWVEAHPVYSNDPRNKEFPPNVVAGAVYEPAGERLTLYRR